MKKIIIPVAAFVTLFFASCGGNHSSADVNEDSMQTKSSDIHSTVKTWKTEGFVHPESVAYSESENCLFISNIGNDDTQPDGFISKVSLTGEILELKWCDSLYSPKGVTIANGAVYVTDLTRLCKVDIATGEIAEVYTNDEIVFLNDVAADDAGNIYVSDMYANAVCKVDSSGSITRIYQNDEIDHPNGIFIQGTKMYMGSWGRVDDSKRDQDTVGKFWLLDLDAMKLTALTEDKPGKLDGIQAYGNDLLVSSWKAGEILKMQKDGTYEVVFTTEESVGDFLYMQDKKLLILPLNFQNRVEAHLL